MKANPSERAMQEQNSQRQFEKDKKRQEILVSSLIVIALESHLLSHFVSQVNMLWKNNTCNEDLS